MKQILTERPNLFEPNVYIAICTKIKNCPSPNRLVAAIKDAYCANENTMSKIVLSQGTASYERLTKSGCTVEITQKDWIDIVKENEKIPFSLETGELIRSFVIPATNNTLLVIMAHHLAGDGKSIIYNLFSKRCHRLTFW